ncbi:hypothetical protein SB49_14050 [Sediminicola sp. YIK13]|uniref:RHS repeat domain-containing protein n=1 Tax=Sediminicola sp. YIK13 TaxID=1453352 RepID=UPI0007211CA3|nr:RHS repeat domain-containing protein [Sediminicola sp. YIK13]ALM08801.1 hypothetical protein SB49_14050 [Sediminicola sp. YIK13]
MRNNKVNLFLSIYILIGLLNLYAQTDLPKIIPLSPNASSIAKYGEIPVSNFTGIPNIEIPLYTINSGELNLPISLSYHAGGNKVESISSWVGLGWSLSSIPSISRSVRGIPDEDGGGYFYKYSGKTIQDIAELDPNNNLWNTFRYDLYNGLADSEPDIFYYNLPNESGKFFFDQESTIFNTYPKSNIKILKVGENFRITTKDGLEYILDKIETTQANNDLPIKSTWYASKMISPTKMDTVHFNYREESHTTKTRNVVTKYHYLSGVNAGLPNNNNSILTINVTKAKVLESIIFKNGQIVFNKQNQEREDLQGGYNLDNISIYNNAGLIRKFDFVTRYITGNGGAGSGTPCYNADSYSKKWMFLDRIRQVAPNTNEVLEHQFAYNEVYSPPCRFSAAQDYWGFYNGKNSNESLTPTYYLPNTSPPVRIQAADRGIDPTKSKFGILKTITYPTKGYSEFDFENNSAYTDEIQVQYDTNQKILSGEEFIEFGQSIPESNSFEVTFTINNPPDLFLNNNNSEGGSNTRFIIEFPGCNISQNASNCARFTVKGITNSIPTTDIYDSNYDPPYDRSLFLPNGTYQMKASFNQSPPNYQDFIFIAEWDIIKNTQAENKYVGGLRINEIRNYPNSSALPMVKKYKYTTDYTSTRSSGDIFSVPNFSHSDGIIYYSGQSNGGETATYLLRVRSTSNIQQVTHSGSSVGYKKVFEETTDANQTGYIEYSFSHSRDISAGGFPYPPEKSREVYRGLPIEKKLYKKSGNVFNMVQKNSWEYSDVPFVFSGKSKYSLGMKWGNDILFNNQSGANAQAQVVDFYTVDVGWNDLVREINTTYHGNDSIQKVTNYYYNNADHLLKSRMDVSDSRGKLLITDYKYPQDIPNPSVAISGLITQNRIAEVIETKSYYDNNNNGVLDLNELLSNQQNDFKVWDSNLISIESLKTSKGNSPLEPRIVYHAYDERGNPLEVSKAEGPSTCYIWGYNKQYPVAKIENARYTQIEALPGFGQNFSLGTGTLNSTQLQTLRSHSSMLGSMVTTYTYNPGVGITSITDTKGLKVTYEYDDFNRLKAVKDANGNLLSENQYKYKNQ